MLLLMMKFWLVLKLDSDDSRYMVNVLMFFGWLMWLVGCCVWLVVEYFGVCCSEGVCYL